MRGPASGAFAPGNWGRAVAAGLVACVVGALAGLGGGEPPGALAAQQPPPSAAATARAAGLSLEEGCRNREAALAELRREREAAVAAAEAAGDPETLALALLRLGEALEQLWLDGEEIAAYERVLSLTRSPVAEIARGRKLVLESKPFFAQGRFEEALDPLRQAREIGEAQADLDLTARALMGLAAVARTQGRPEETRARLEEALDLALRGENPTRAAIAYYNLGALLAATGEHDAAAETFRRGFAAAQGNRRLLVFLLSGLSNVEQVQGDLGAALRALHLAMDLLEGGAFPAQLVDVVSRIGSLYTDLRQHSLARHYHERGLELAAELGDELARGRALFNLAYGALEARDPDRALAYLERARPGLDEAGAKEELVRYFQALGGVMVLKGDLDQAERAFRESHTLATAIGALRTSAFAERLLAEVELERGRHEPAAELARRAARLAAEQGYADGYWQARAIEGLAMRALGRHEAARQALEETVTVLEDLRDTLVPDPLQRQRFLGLGASAYAGLVDVLAASGRTEEAFHYAERARARSLVEAITVGGTEPPSSLSPDEEKRGEKLQAKLVELNHQLLLAQVRVRPEAERVEALASDLRRTRLELEAFRARAAEREPALARRRGDFAVAGAEDLARLLPPRTALLEYVLLEKETLLFLLRSEGLSVLRLPYPRRELEREVEDFRRRVAGRDLGFHEGAQRLFERLIRPALPRLAGVEQLCLVPDGKLWELPFQALESAPDRFLIEDWSTFYAPSANALAAISRHLAGRRGPGTTARAAADSRRLLALGNPALAAEPARRFAAAERGLVFDPLPEAEEEVRALGELYGGGSAEVFIGGEATEERVKRAAGGHEVVHLAAHSVLDGANPMYSYVLLARDPAGREDGLLEAWEMMDLALDAELVVLSGCQTAGGEVAPGEGLIGMSWALFAAGSPTVVASQWAVDSARTGQLMVAFHRHLVGGAPKARALQRAAAEMLGVDAHRHPYYWAGFILIGDGLGRLEGFDARGSEAWPSGVAIPGGSALLP